MIDPHSHTLRVTDCSTFWTRAQAHIDGERPTTGETTNPKSGAPMFVLIIMLSRYILISG